MQCALWATPCLWWQWCHCECCVLNCWWLCFILFYGQHLKDCPYLQNSYREWVNFSEVEQVMASDIIMWISTMGAVANIPATFTECIVFVFRVRDCSNNIPHHTDFWLIISVCHLCPRHWYMLKLSNFFQLDREGPDRWLGRSTA